MKSGKDRAAQKLRERDFKLNTLLEVSHAINNQEYDETLFNHFQNILIDKLSLGKGLLISDYNGWSVNLQFGLRVINEMRLIERCREFDRITVLNDVNDPVLTAFDVIIPIFHNKKALSYLLLGDFDGEKIEVSPIIRHLPFIQTLTNLIVVAQENRRLFKESLEKAAMQRELELASRIQGMLIPDETPDKKDLDIYARYQPHQVVGGDYYDFFQIDDNRTVFCIADVSGKGLSAAMIMSNFQAMMHALTDSDKNLEKSVEALNARVGKNTHGEKFITAFIAIYDHSKRELTYVNSGHQPPLFCHKGVVKELNVGSSILGAFEELPSLKVGKQKIAENDTIVCFTDGVCEVVNKHDEEFGTDIMKDILPHQVGNPAISVVDNIMKEIKAFKGTMAYPDDLALFAVRFL